MTEDEWIRVILAIAIGLLILPRLMGNDRPGQQTSGTQSGNIPKKRPPNPMAKFSMFFVAFGAIAVFLLWQFTDFIS